MNTKLFKYSVIAILIGLFTNTNCIAQDNEAKDFKMLYKFNTTKLADNSRLLQVSFIAQHKKDRKNKVPVYEAEINFYNTSNEEDILLGTVKTDKEGFARLTLPADQTYLTDVEGYINFKAEFKKTKAIKRYKKSIAVKDLILDLNLEEIDSIKTVMVKAYILDSLNTKLPVEEADAIFSVRGMINNMPIETATIEDGEYEFEFQTNIPGDVNGIIDVFVSIEDHDDFGNVIQQKSVNWGISKEQFKEDSNTLWSEAAPIWMYIVLTILLGGVWIKYIYVIKNLFKIRSIGKELEIKQESETEK